MEPERQIDPQHDAIRGFLRTVGPVLIVIGALLLVVGVGSFFAGFSSFGRGGMVGPPQHFWMAFVGMPILAAGLALTKWGYLGAAARYAAGEVAPVAKDAVNYLGEGAREGVTAVAEAIKEGLAGEEAETAACPHCGEDNRPGAAYCHHCGQALARSCPGCGAANQPDADFCDRCGRRLGPEP